jgi:putative spermidine/putrescine transport system permease protein
MTSLDSIRRTLHRNTRARIASLLALPLFWLVVLYIGSLAALFITSIWKIDTFTSKVVREFTLQNFIDVLTDKAYFNVTVRTLFVAVCVTVICAFIAIPMAFFMARIARPRSRPILIALVITPLWASYLVKVLPRKRLYQLVDSASWWIKPWVWNVRRHYRTHVFMASLYGFTNLRRNGKVTELSLRCFI